MIHFFFFFISFTTYIQHPHYDGPNCKYKVEASNEKRKLAKDSYSLKT